MKNLLFLFCAGKIFISILVLQLAVNFISFMDRFFSFVFLFLTFPFLLIIGCVILLVERKSPLFFQDRIGKNRKVFTLVKLRTMKDNKITVIGAVLRKTGIDEIPQLLNIISGDMNFIGPRPLTQSDVVRLGWESDYYKVRWHSKPGLTGLAQLSPICHKKVSFFLDKYYVINKSFCLDVKIFVMSFLVLFLGKHNVKKMIAKRQVK